MLCLTQNTTKICSRSHPGNRKFWPFEWCCASFAWSFYLINFYLSTNDCRKMVFLSWNYSTHSTDLSWPANQLAQSKRPRNQYAFDVLHNPKQNLNLLFVQVTLTMEEKEKLAREQEFQNRCKTSEVPLQPITSKSTTAKTTPKDLTSTLINNNLSMLSSQAPPFKTTASLPVQGFSNSVFPNYTSSTMLGLSQPRMTLQPARSSAFDSIPTGISPKTTRNQPMSTMGSGMHATPAMNFSTMNNNINGSMNNWLNNSAPTSIPASNAQVVQNLSSKDIQDLLGWFVPRSHLCVFLEEDNCVYFKLLAIAFQHDLLMMLIQL